MEVQGRGRLLALRERREHIRRQAMRIENQEAGNLERLVAQGQGDPFGHLELLQAMHIHVDQHKRCGACLEKNKQYNEEEMRRPLTERRCESCLTKGRRIAKRYHACPVSSFFRKVFGEEEQKRFESWMDKNRNILDVLDGDPDYEKEMNDFDRILGAYDKEYFRRLCQQVDPITRLYPLQTAIELDLQWEEGVYHIFQADEEVIGFTHPRTMLLPFQMAAMSSYELCFQLLRQTPEHALEKLRDPNILHKEDKPLPLVFAQTEDGGYIYSSDEEEEEDDECSEVDNDDLEETE